MDTRFWGPSGWQLLHYISFHSKNSEQFLFGIKDILPCRYCRESTAQFQHELKYKGNIARWFYEIHNRINHKLRAQSKDDPSVVDPGPNPTFEEVSKKYKHFKLDHVLGRDFLFSIAVNYPAAPEPDQMATQRVFLKQLVEVYPSHKLKQYYEEHPPRLESQRSYMHWVYGVLKELSDEVGVPMPSYKKYSKHVLGYKSGCSKKRYRGKTCRKARGTNKTIRIVTIS